MVKRVKRVPFGIAEGKLLKIGGDEEKVLAKYLRDWVGKNVTKETQKRLGDISRIKGYGAWLAAMKDVSEEDERAYRVLELIDELSEKR